MIIMKTAKLPQAATAMLLATISTTAVMTSYQLAAIVREQHKIFAAYMSAVCFLFHFLALSFQQKILWLYCLLLTLDPYKLVALTMEWLP